MKKITLFLFFVLLSTTSLLSQNLYIESLTLDENNLRAQINPKLDFNDKKCCVILINTPNMDDAQRHKLEFEGDAGAEVVSVDFPTGEIEIYFSSHAATLTIRHPDLGKLDYDIPIDLKEMKTYKMVLMSARATTIVEESLTANYLVINVEPKDARIFIDNEFVENKNGAAMKLLSIGVEHSLRIEKNLYHSLDTIVITNASNTLTINKKLRPAFGYIEVKSLPESGATVIINDKEVGTTPYRSAELSSGEYEVRVIKSMYKQSSKTVRVIDGNTTEANIEMQPNFAEITLVTDSESTIYLDGNVIGKGKWTGRILAGSHIVEAKRESHRDIKRTITVEASKNETITIDNPIPIYGSLNIISDPLDATIYIDNQEVGKTPKILTQVLIGRHTIRLEKQGCTPFTKEIYIEEGKVYEMECELSNTKTIKITSEKAGDVVYVDGKKVGVTPHYAALSFGKHIVRVERCDFSGYKEINVTSQSESEINILLDGKIVVKTDHSGDYVYINGKYAGTTPLTKSVSAGKYEVKIERSGNYESIHKTVNVGSGQKIEIIERLKKTETDTKMSNNRSNYSQNHDKFKKKRTIITLDFAYSTAPQASFGLTFGQVKKIGWFVSAASNFNFNAMSAKLESEDGTIDGVTPFYTDKTCKSRLSIMGGVFIGLAKQVYLKIGAGYGCRALAQQTIDGTWIKNKAFSTSGIDFGGGFQFLFGGFSMSIEAVITNFKYAECKVGLGINF